MRKHPDSKPLICFGQDECIFKQFLFTKNCWVAPNGTRHVIPKDDGTGVMISAFTSWEFGFGFPLSQENLLRVNRKRRGETYGDKPSAWDKL